MIVSSQHKSHQMIINAQNIDPAEAATQIVETLTAQTETNHAMFGGLAGMIVSTVLHPLEVLKIGIIMNPMKLELSGPKSFLIVGRYIRQTEGFRGFFRGLTPEIVRSCAGTSMYFHILKDLEMCFSRLNNSKKEDQLSQFSASALARMAAAYFTNPLGVVASRCQVPGFSVYSNMFDGFLKIYKYEGLGSFMKGSLASAMKEGPFAGTYYVIYRFMKKHLLEIEEQSHYLCTSLVSGMTAGFIATTVSHPFEIIRARLQIISKFDKNSDYQYTGIADAFKKIYQHEGFSGYFRGLMPRLVRKPLANAMTFSIFELFHNSHSSTKW